MSIQETLDTEEREVEIEKKRRSALGIGVTTLVTIMVVLLLASFSVLSLVSAQSNYHLASMSAEQTELFYFADSEATSWYAELDTFAATLQDPAETYAEQLSGAGYEVEITNAGEIRVMESFIINEYRMLTVTIAVNDDKTTTIRQWQS